jgi:F0F1-type ATP synthase epsilon subunit
MKLSQRLASFREKLGAIEGAAEVAAGLADLVEQAKPFDDLDPNSAREAIAKLPEIVRLQETLSQAATERDQFKAQVADLGSVAAGLARDVVVARGLGRVGVLPAYQDLIEPAIAGMVQADDQGNYSLPEDFATSLRDKYPAMFAPESDGAGTGTSTSTSGPAKDKQPTQVASQGGVITGVDPGDVMDGKVQITA